MSSIDLTVRTRTHLTTSQPQVGGKVNAEARPQAVLGPDAKLPGTAESEKQTASGQSVQTQMSKNVEQLNRIMQDVRRELKFTIDEATGETIIRVLDAGTQEVVRQIPSEEVLALMSHLQQDGKSLLVDVKA